MANCLSLPRIFRSCAADPDGFIRMSPRQPVQGEIQKGSAMTTSKLAGSTKARILVVDDTPDNLYLMSALLEDTYEVATAESGVQALEMVHSATPPELILLDIMMPGMDGYEVM